MSFVKISSNIRPREEEAFSVIRFKNKSILTRIQNKALRILKQRAPRKTGAFRKSIKIIESSMRESSGMSRGFVKIMPTSPKTRFIIKKTRPSQGVYVPALGKRIKFGMHPGTASNNFITASKPIIIREAKKIVDEHYGRGKFDIKRFIR